MSKRHNDPTSNTYRFFVAPDAIRGIAVQIDDAALLKQLNTVLRLGVGDAITLLDNSGWEYSVSLDQIDRKQVRGTVMERTLARTEPRLRLALYVALMRAERFEWVLQKGTELGVATFVPVVCERSKVDEIAQIKHTKLQRWQRIIAEAAEQSRRAVLPTLEPAVLFATACEYAARCTQSALLWEGDGAESLTSIAVPIINRVGGDPGTVAVLSGPEGGFSRDELRTAQRYGVHLATLGPRTLRAETAPIAATSALLFACGDLG